MSIRSFASVPAATALTLTLVGSGEPRIPAADRVRLAEAFRLFDAIEARVWPGWKQAPFAVLLVTPEREFLLRHPSPTADFTRAGRDDDLGSGVYTRPRQFSPELLATFPAVSGVSTVVVGPREQTGLETSARWVLTILHEHFHQYQESPPDYYTRVNALGLARGDTSGTWMLQYPFPYEKPEAIARVDAYARALDAALDATAGAPLDSAVAVVRAARGDLRAAIDPDDDRYLSFQLWKEGVARYVELRAAEAARFYTPSAAFRALPDAGRLANEASRIHAGIREGLASPRLAERKRVAFYAIGAAEAMLLDRVNPSWKRQYLAANFTLEPLMAAEAGLAARRLCPRPLPSERAAASRSRNAFAAIPRDD